MTTANISRRFFLTGGTVVGAAALASCQSRATQQAPVPPPKLPTGPVSQPGVTPSEADYAAMYGPFNDGGFNLPGIPWQNMDRRFLRQTVPYFTGEGPGTVVIETSQHLLYFTQPSGMAIRYGVGLGRAGFEWTGTGDVGRKAEWPRWHPPDEMIARQPELEKYKTIYDKKNDEWLGGMDPGPGNPLGARALYIFQGEEDTQYRLHGSPEWNSIGQSVSSGCVRLINQDVVDLFSRVPEGTPVIVR